MFHVAHRRTTVADLRLLVVGDSQASEWPKRLPSDVEVAMLAEGRNITTRTGRKRYELAVRKFPAIAAAEYLVVALGTIDAIQGLPERDWLIEMSYLAGLVQQPHVLVILPRLYDALHFEPQSLGNGVHMTVWRPDYRANPMNPYVLQSRENDEIMHYVDRWLSRGGEDDEEPQF